MLLKRAAAMAALFFPIEVLTTHRPADSVLGDQRAAALRGRPSGFLIYNIAPDSIFERMGFENGDVISALNGRPFETTMPVAEFYAALSEGGVLALAFMRAEAKQTLHLAIQWKIQGSNSSAFSLKSADIVCHAMQGVSIIASVIENLATAETR